MAHQPVRKSIRGRSARTGGRAEGGSRRERRTLLQLVLCSLLFVSLVGLKLCLPARMEAFDARLAELLRQNMDVQSVFSAIGMLAAGETEGQEMLQAVFQPQKAAIPADDPVRVPVTEEPRMALALFRESLPAWEAQDQGEPETVEAALPYLQEELPEDVSMEQVVLGLDCEMPVRGTLTSDFGYREHPVSGARKFHYGLDLAAEEGTEVRSFADGTVTAVGESSSYGNYCIVEHEGGVETLYAHCRTISVSSGSDVRRGQKLGEVGHTGLTTGTHLHFEVHKNGLYLNPIYYVAL